VGEYAGVLAWVSSSRLESASKSAFGESSKRMSR
jgi:hypothetical protein